MDEQLMRQAMSEMGKRGGMAKHKRPKGLAAVSPERRAEIAALGVSARKLKKKRVDNLKRLT
jgi:hypothetical protein